MAVVLGTNAGFVTVAPTADPADNNQTVATTAIARASTIKDTSPASSVRITEIGWWCETANNEANYEVGLYAADGAVVPGEAGARLFVDATNAKGTTQGWKKVTVDWAISPNIDYWLAIQNDVSNTNTQTNAAVTGGLNDEISATSLPNPFGGGAISGTLLLAIYAVVERASASPSVSPSASISPSLSPSISPSVSPSPSLSPSVSPSPSLSPSLSPSISPSVSPSPPVDTFGMSSFNNSY